jgi:hypothetical protein
MRNIGFDLGGRFALLPFRSSFLRLDELVTLLTYLP